VYQKIHQQSYPEKDLCVLMDRTAGSANLYSDIEDLKYALVHRKRPFTFHRAHYYGKAI